VTIAQDVRAAVRAAHNSCCGYCGVSETLVGGELEIDHFRPFSRGGADTLEWEYARYGNS
jgi:5-methylcytosine-specific restriction endonuclease McrA